MNIITGIILEIYAKFMEVDNQSDSKILKKHYHSIKEWLGELVDINGVHLKDQWKIQAEISMTALYSETTTADMFKQKAHERNAHHEEIGNYMKNMLGEAPLPVFVLDQGNNPIPPIRPVNKFRS